MTDTETRVTSPTGGEKGTKLPAFGGIDPRAALELARVYGFGERKYARYNYLKGYKWSLTVDALFRHLFAFLDREDNDPESGLNHMAHVAWHALTLLAFSLRGIGEDDRFNDSGRIDTFDKAYDALWGHKLSDEDMDAWIVTWHEGLNVKPWR
jgi:hypothetical protein